MPSSLCISPPRGPTGRSPGGGAPGDPAPGASLLTEQELRWFGGSCFNVLPAQGPNLFLSVSFDRAADMDLTALFTGGAGSRDLSDRELRQLGAEGYARLTASELEDLLLRYTGLSLADMSDAAFDGLTYLADFDAYYGPGR